MKLPALLYNALIIPILFLGFHFLALFNQKIRRGIAGRKHLFAHLQQQLRRTASQQRLLIHVASMGEFEQARPVLRAVRQRFPDVLRCVSVFSPSAYDHLQGHAEIDVLTYLPFDSLPNVRSFLEMLDPAVLIFVRYDLWPNLVWQARRRGCHTMLIDASLQETSWRHKPLIRQFNKAIFASLDRICAISAQAAAQIQAAFAPAATIEVTGDTRFDQVVFRAKEKPLADILPFPFANWGQALVAGSTWPEDEAILLPAFAKLCQQAPNPKLILAPHEPSETHLTQCEKSCSELGLQALRLSKCDGSANCEVLLIDRIGILANLYAAAEVAFVGGGFGPGVHSVIEAAAHGVPVLFGPKMRNSPEAIAMIERGCGFVVADGDRLYAQCHAYYTDADAKSRVANLSLDFVAARTGADHKIADLLESVLINR